MSLIRYQMPVPSKDLLTRIREEKVSNFQALWMSATINQRKNIREAAKTWNVGYSLRFAYTWEINMLRSCGARVHIFDVMQHDGSFAIDVSHWSEIPEEIHRYTQEWSVKN